MDGMQAIDPHSDAEAPTGMPAGDGEQPGGTAAAKLLLHAQQVADELRSQAEQQAGDAMALAERL